MKRIRRYIIEVWQPSLLYGVVGAGLALLFAYRLGSLPAGMSPQEVSALQTSQTWQNILNNPLYGPHKLLLLIMQTAGLHRLGLLRIISVIWALSTIGLFYSVLKRWYSVRVSALGTLLFACSTWLLIAARSITPEIMQSSIVLILAIGTWLRYSRARNLPVLLAVFLAALLCYIPGMVWFLVGAALWQRKTIKNSLREASLPALFGIIVLFLALLSPLVLGIARDPLLLRSIVGLPSQLPTLEAVLKGFASIPLALFLRAPLNPAHWLGRLPLLDIFSAVMFALGLYSFYYQLQLDRVKLLAGAGLIIVVLIAISGSATLTMLLPLVYIVITAGIDLLLRQWLQVFPRNPLARGVGIGLLMLAVFVACFYQVWRYYAAWQHAPSTKQIYSHHPKS